MTNDTATQELINRAKAGDHPSFEALVARYDGHLRTLVARKLGEHLAKRVEARDVVQETLLRGFRSIEGFRWQGESSFLRWLGSIAEHVIHEAARANRRRPALPLEIDPAAKSLSQSKAMRRSERFDRLEDALHSLSAEHRMVILLARMERLPMKEVAVRMNRSYEATKQLLFRALRELKTRFGETESLHLPERGLKERGETHGS